METDNGNVESKDQSSSVNKPSVNKDRLPNMFDLNNLPNINDWGHMKNYDGDEFVKKKFNQSGKNFSETETIFEEIDWDDLKVHNDNEENQDNAWFINENEKLVKLYGENILSIRCSKQGKVEYFCKLCLVKCNSKTVVDFHCSGMKHLKKKNTWESDGQPKHEDNLEAAQTKKINPPKPLPINIADPYYEDEQDHGGNNKRDSGPPYQRSSGPRNHRDLESRNHRDLGPPYQRDSGPPYQRDSGPPYQRDSDPPNRRDFRQHHDHEQTSSRSDSHRSRRRRSRSRSPSDYTGTTSSFQQHQTMPRFNRESSPMGLEPLSDSVTGKLITKLAMCCVKDNEDVELGMNLVCMLSKSLREYFTVKEDKKVAEVMMEAEVKLGTVKALRAGLSMINSQKAEESDTGGYQTSSTSGPRQWRTTQPFYKPPTNYNPLRRDPGYSHSGSLYNPFNEESP